MFGYVVISTFFKPATPLSGAVVMKKNWEMSGIQGHGTESCLHFACFAQDGNVYRNT